MPAECRFPVNGEPCSVLAVGRCEECGDPFCPSHRFHAPSGTPTKVCVRCGMAQSARIARRVETEKQERERRWEAAKAAAQQVAALAPTLMRERPDLVTTVHVHRLQRRWGRYSVAWDRRRGVQVGDYFWHDAGGDRPGMRPTVVLEDGSVWPLNPDWPGGLRVGGAAADVTEPRPYAAYRSGLTDEDWVALARRLAELRRTG